MNKILILSTARTGTNYFIESLNKSPKTLIYTECLDTSLFMMHNKKDSMIRLMIGDSNKDLQLITDDEIEELKQIQEESHRDYWNKLWNLYTTRAEDRGIENIGIKFFPCYLFRSPDLLLDDILSKFDKFVFIERDPLEIFYSKIKITQLHHKWMDVAIYGTDHRQRIKDYVPTSQGVTQTWLNQWINSWIGNDLRFLKEVKKRIPDHLTIQYDTLGSKEISEYCNFQFTDFHTYDKMKYDYKEWLNKETMFKTEYEKLISTL